MAESGTTNGETSADKFEVPILALQPKTKSIISSLLNPVKILPTNKGLRRDWHGLAQLVGIKGQHMPNLQSNTDPTSKILEIWYDTDQKSSTIKILLDYLEELDRFDVIDDIKLFLDEDIKLYNDRIVNGKSAFDDDLNENILTEDDAIRFKLGQELLRYDAFVLFAEEDINFATELLHEMERRELRLITRKRDLLGGAFEHDSIIRLIANRCNRLIIIISEAFLASAANSFFVRFTQAHSIAENKRKIIPCMINPCEVPVELRYYFILNYNATGKLWNFWDKLYQSVSPCEQPQRKTNLSRTLSQPVRPRDKVLCPTTQDSNTMNPKKEVVKFKSTVNLSDSDSITVENGSSSANSLSNVSTDSKKTKKVIKYMRKVLLVLQPTKKQSLPKSQPAVTEVAVPEKDKRKFWHRHRKQKVAVAN